MLGGHFRGRSPFARIQGRYPLTSTWWWVILFSRQVESKKKVKRCCRFRNEWQHRVTLRSRCLGSIPRECKPLASSCFASLKAERWEGGGKDDYDSAMSRAANTWTSRSRLSLATNCRDKTKQGWLAGLNSFQDCLPCSLATTCRAGQMTDSRGGFFSHRVDRQTDRQTDLVLASISLSIQNNQAQMMYLLLRNTLRFYYTYLFIWRS